MWNKIFHDYSRAYIPLFSLIQSSFHLYVNKNVNSNMFQLSLKKSNASITIHIFVRRELQSKVLTRDSE